MVIEYVNITEIKSSNLQLSILNRVTTNLNDCNENSLEIYDGSTSFKNKILSFCNTVVNKVLKSQSNKIFIHLTKNSDKVFFQFKIIYNPFKIGKKLAD
jgi:hypothetical protein